MTSYKSLGRWKHFCYLSCQSKMFWLVFVLLGGSEILDPSEAFSLQTFSHSFLSPKLSCYNQQRFELSSTRMGHSHVREVVALCNKRRWDDEIEKNSRQRLQRSTDNSGIGETAVGAVLGGLLGGPFGALFGASIGSNIGARNAISKARSEEMKRLGLSQDMLDMANEIGSSLERAYEGLKAIQESLSTQQKFAKMLDNDAKDYYERAMDAVNQNQEEQARNLLMKRTSVQDKLKEVLLRCAEEKKRLQIMEENVTALERRAMEVDSLLRRNVSAKTLTDSSDLGLSLRSEDPLLKKFKDLGID